MNCPICQNKTKVSDSRISERGKSVRRRRFCPSCTRRFTTYEKIELTNFEVLKRNGEQEPYHKRKLEIGLRKALEKRPYQEASFQKLIAGIEGEIFSLGKPVVSSKRIGKIVLERLRNFDETAYLRFASVYRKFGSPESFEKEIRELITTKKSKAGN